MKLDELILRLHFEAGDVRSLVEYLQRELKDDWAKEFFAGVLYGEIPRGDLRRDRSESETTAMVFWVKRQIADFNEKEHGEPHRSNASIYAEIDAERGYQDGTSERHMKRHKRRRKFLKGDTNSK